MGIASRELQHCNAATARAEPSLLELCRAPAVVDGSQRRNSESRASLLELCRAPAVVDEVNAAMLRAKIIAEK